MAWVASLLADYFGQELDSRLAESRPSQVAEFFAPFVRAAPRGMVHLGAREEYEAAISADRILIEETMQPGDLLRPWWMGSYAVGRVGVAILRGEHVVKAWETAVLV